MGRPKERPFMSVIRGALSLGIKCLYGIDFGPTTV